MWPMRELVPTKSKPVADIPFLFCILEGWILLSFAHDVFLSFCVFCFVYGKTASHAKEERRKLRSPGYKSIILPTPEIYEDKTIGNKAPH